MMPDNLNKYLTQAGFYMPAFRHFGISDDQSLVMGAFLDRMGLGAGKGGSGLASFVQNQLGSLAITGHVDDKRAKALHSLGLLNSDGTSKFYNNGHYDVFGSLQQIDNDAREMTRGLKGHALDAKSQEVAKYIQAALGVQGGRIGFLGSDDALKVLHDMVDALRHAPSLKQDQAMYMNNLGPSFQRATSNIRSVVVEALWPSLGALSSFFNDIGNAAHKFQVLIHKNKSISSTIAEWWNKEQGKIGNQIVFGFGYLAEKFREVIINFFRTAANVFINWITHPYAQLERDKSLWHSLVDGVNAAISGPISDSKRHTAPVQNHTHNVTINVHGSKDAHATAKQVSEVLIQHYKSIGSRSNLAVQSRHALA